jgi:vacuolar-type H+-ATPase subunit B/Vma2
MKRLDAPMARTYSGAASAAGPLLFVRSTRRAKLGEWVRIGGDGQEDWRGQVIDVGTEITVIQVFEDTLGLKPADVAITLSG